jgi:hypothetical protein
MRGDRTFQTAGVRNAVTVSGVGSVTTNRLGSGVTVQYTASSDSYRLTAPDGTTATFTPADLDRSQSSLPVLAAYGHTIGGVEDDFVIATPSVGGVALSYTVIGSWVHSTNPSTATIYAAVGGVPTLASDMPRTGSASYNGALSGTVIQSGEAFGVDTGSSATFSADFAALTVQTSFALSARSLTSGTTRNFGSFSGIGTIMPASPSFSGTLTGSAANGGFSGAFFGPAAKEMGYGWGIDAGTFTAVGTVVGIKR